MHKNYLNIALRTLERHKGFAFISIFGLALGIACCVLIFMYVRSELAVNTVFTDVDRLYRVDSQWREETMGQPFATLAPVGQTLQREYPEVAHQVRVYGMTNAVRVGEESYRKEVMMADSSLLRVFDLPLLHGDPATALSQPRSVIITEDLAETFFGVTNAMGKTVLLETWNSGWQPYTVTGVRKTLPYNSLTYFGAQEGYDVIISPYPYGDYLPEAGWTSWQSRYILQFIKLAPNVSVEALQVKLDDFIETHAPAEFHGNLQIRLNPLRTLYLTDNDRRGWRVIWLLSVVAFLILLVACTNFTNLAVARSFSRMKEIGVRKVVGAQRGQLIGQFLDESLLNSFLAMLLGVLLAALCLKPFMQLFEKEFVLEAPWDGLTLFSLLGLMLLVGLMAGAYPAFILSSFRPARALKGPLRFSRSAIWLRRSLVVTQFAMAAVLMISVYTISRQLSFITEKDLGFDKEQVLVIESVPREFNEAGLAKVKTARERLSAVPNVRSVSASWGTAAGGGGNTRAMLPPGRNPDEAASVPYFLVDEAFLKTYGLALQAGRFFSENHPAEVSGIVLNERAARAFGWEPREAVGQSLSVWHTARPGGDMPPPHPVIGVVADHHFQSLHEAIQPLAYFSVEAEPRYRILSLRLTSSNLSQTVAAVKEAWNEVFPAAPFDYVFLDDELDRAYRTEQQIHQLVSVAAILAILIACLGLLGLASLSAVQRTKEIGVRKVMGASVPDIVFLLSCDFLQLVLVALLIAAPIAYLVMSRWLEDFAYRIQMSWETFLVIGLVALAAAWLTVSYHSIKAALANPVDSLQHE